MVLRSGIILPFQFRDCKKLLMVGVPGEDRNLSVWDLKSVVRAAFGIYNFEFRNKKIGFSIPEELLLQYLAQRHDLTNFVIEIGQENENENDNDNISITDEGGAAAAAASRVQKSNESAASCDVTSQATQSSQQHQNRSTNVDSDYRMRTTNHNNANAPVSLTRSMGQMEVVPKSELTVAAEKIATNRIIQHQQQQQQHISQGAVVHPMHHHHQQQQQQLQQPQHFISNYGHHPINLLSIAVNNVTTTTAPLTTQLTQHGGSGSQRPLQPPTPYSVGMNRFRKRGERMSKDQKELYVKYLEENPSMLSQRRNDMTVEPLWNKLATILNSVPQGAVKNVEEWKQTFDAWRYRVFMYTRYNSKLAGRQDDNPKIFKPLTATDQRAYAIWTNQKTLAIQEFDRIDMFSNIDETQSAGYTY